MTESLPSTQVQSPKRKVVAALPGGDWVAHATHYMSYDVLTWLVFDDGGIEPVALARDGRPFRPTDKAKWLLTEKYADFMVVSKWREGIEARQDRAKAGEEK